MLIYLYDQITNYYSKKFTGHIDNDKCNILGLETAAIPRRVKVQHIKGIVNTLADSVSRPKAVGIYHDIDSDDHQQEFSTPFESLPPVKPVTHTSLEVNEVIIMPDMERLTQTYDTFHDPPTVQTVRQLKLSLENASPADIPQLKEILMSLLKLTLDKVVKLQESDFFCKNILQHISYSKHEKYFQEAMGILHKKVVDFKNMFSAVVVPQILIKYLLHASHNSLGYVGATE